ncbi:hypothetical protein AAG906_006902 [Vitis piasezkii]
MVLKTNQSAHPNQIQTPSEWVASGRVGASKLVQRWEVSKKEGIEGEGWWGSVSASLLEQSWFLGGVIEEEQGEISSPPGS